MLLNGKENACLDFYNFLFISITLEWKLFARPPRCLTFA